MISLHILRPNGNSFVLEIEETKTVADVKEGLEVEVGLPVSQQKLLLDIAILEDEMVLSEINGLGSPESCITLVHDTHPPWCWPCRDVQSEPLGAHKLTLFEDPEVTEEEVLYQDAWDEEFDQRIMERWRKRGLLCIPGLGSYAGCELKFEYLENRCIVSQHGNERNSNHTGCVFRDSKDADAGFVQRCLNIALACPSERVWPEEALQYSASIEWRAPQNPISVAARLLDEANIITLQVSKSASFAELYHTVAVELFRNGHYFPDGFELWAADGCAALPTGSLKFLQPALRSDDQEFACVVVSRSQSAVAIAGEGLFSASSVPEKEEGTGRVGLTITCNSRPIMGPGMRAVAGLSSKSQTNSGKRERVALSELSAEIAEADDWAQLAAPEPGSVVQLFKITRAGLLHTTVRKTGDGNMVGGSFNSHALPAEANSAVVRSWLAAASGGGKGWARLATAHDHHSSIHFTCLQDYEASRAGLCICSASVEER